MVKISLIISFLVTVQLAQTARILGVFPFPNYSHFIAGEVLLQELAARGHEVVVISSHPEKRPLKNYSVVEISGVKKYMDEMTKDFNFLDFAQMNWMIKSWMVISMGFVFEELTYQDENVQRLLKSNNTFDLVIQENFYMEGFYGLCHKYKAPCISMSAVGATVLSNRLTGNSGMASYVPAYMTDYYSPGMTFFQRLQNLICVTFEQLLFHYYALPMHDKIMHDQFPDAPNIAELIYNTSFVFLNSDPALTAPVPLTPNMKEIAGMHIKSDSALPKDIQKFLDENNDVVYFALGSNMQSKDLPIGKLEEIIAAFKKWGRPILWKFEDELPEKLNNVKTAKWLPQTAVLAHKNVKVFITHCGRFSTLEALYFGVPMIGIPIFAEQPFNAAQMEFAGYGIYLRLEDVNKDSLYNGLVEVTSNPKYNQQAKLRSKAMQGKPQKSLDEAVFWVNYVIEFNGAPHLRNAGIDLPWYQFWMVDVVVFIISVAVTINVIIAYVIINVCCKSKSSTKNKQKQKTQ